MRGLIDANRIVLFDETPHGLRRSLCTCTFLNKVLIRNKLPESKCKFRHTFIFSDISLSILSHIVNVRNMDTILSWLLMNCRLYGSLPFNVLAGHHLKTVKFEKVNI